MTDRHVLSNILSLCHTGDNCMNCRYNITIVEDGKYGAENPDTGEWNGLIGEILRGETDLVAAPVSIIASREKVVDFTAPFLADGTGILMKKPSGDEDRFIRVFKPFEYVVRGHSSIHFQFWSQNPETISHPKYYGHGQLVLCRVDRW